MQVVATQNAEHHIHQVALSRIETTYLEMHARSELCPKRAVDERFSIREATTVQWQLNRFMYLLVGGQWSWKDKAGWSDDQWKVYAASPSLRTFTAAHDGSPAGYFELFKHADHSVELAYLGLTPAFIGRGYGGALLTKAIEESWEMKPARVWVHTCTLDHPAALENYLSRGFKIYRTESPPFTQGTPDTAEA